MSVSGTDALRTPTRACLACRLQKTRLGPKPAPRTPLSGCPYSVGRHSTWPLPLRSTVPPVFIALSAGLESSPASHRLRLWGLDLGPASPCADRHGAGTLGLSVVEVFTPLCAYSFRHPHFSTLHVGSHHRFDALRTLPYPSDKVRRPSFGGPLNPDHSRRIPTGLVSYYALFKGVAASKPTSQLSK